MARRKGTSCKYELMLEQLLRRKKIPYVAVNEKKRPITRWRAIKNFDFIIHSKAGNYTADVKGKLFPQESRDGKNKIWWPNWIHDTDLEGLSFWDDIMGEGFTTLIIFTYRVIYEEDIFKFWDLFNFQSGSYGLVACTLESYKKYARFRSRSWKVYWVPGKIFRKIIRPLSYFIPEISAA